MKIRAIAMIVAVAGMAFAGCVRENPDESGGDIGTPCATHYVTTHWEGTFEEAELRDAFEEADWNWVSTARGETDDGALLETRDSPAAFQGVASLDPPGDVAVEGVVSYDPGTSSGESLILSFEETSPNASPDAVNRVARDAAQIVNATFEDMRVEQWIEDSWTGSCGEPGGIPAGPG